MTNVLLSITKEKYEAVEGRKEGREKHTFIVSNQRGCFTW